MGLDRLRIGHHAEPASDELGAREFSILKQVYIIFV